MSADEQPVAAAAAAAAVVAEASTDAVADVERSKKILAAKELYSRGSRNYLVKSYAESADELSMVCELYQELYGELSDELGMPYLLYAKSLIALALDENKVIDVPDEEDDDEEEENDDEAAEDDAAAAADDDEAVASSNSKPTNGVVTQPKPLEDEVADESSTAAKKTAEDDEADSTAAEAEESNVASVPADGKTSSAKSASDEAMVSSTEDGGAPAAAHKAMNGTGTNGDAKVDVEKPSTSGTATDVAVDEEDEENEAASTLQLAWEILELAGKIFERQGISGLPNLAEVQTELANIEFENNILESARDDYEKALQIYDELPTNYRRAMAEIHYKIGLSYLMQQMNKEGAASLKEACSLIENEIIEWRAKEDPTEKDKSTIKDMEETKEEILLKISEIEEAEAQHLAEVRAALDKVIAQPGAGESVTNTDGAGPSSSADAQIADGASSSSCTSTVGPATISSSTKPTDISHLIKRKKPEEPTSEAEAVQSPAKRSAV